ncbi:hypothetical protein FHK02_3491 [Spirosoma sp. LMG 31448]|uniref:Uncharacterized protein n=1 Tax=Spirosoma utsteinense TaxID=2585773 RepID=A0ABR6WBY4_9BACT|nr:hypothetical protein [Spirosoma utsteinense]MBC3793437.1 hypothetical protein [Spirosoma utsteinense]
MIFSVLSVATQEKASSSIGEPCSLLNTFECTHMYLCYLSSFILTYDAYRIARKIGMIGINVFSVYLIIRDGL